MTYAQKSWAEERSSWHVVILFNLVRNVNTIADALNEETTHCVSAGIKSTLTEWHRSILFRLSPLRRIEKDLKALLGSGTSEALDLDLPSSSNIAAESKDPTQMRTKSHSEGHSPQEFSIWSSSGWKSILDQVRNKSQGKESQVPHVVRTVLVSCKDDINAIWNETVAQDVLRSRYGRLEETPGLYVSIVNIVGLTS